nr:retrovirus-related Pol polyprotein from transposon TNT 1-94 [Tanacetum cinerariifolium]
MNHQTSTVPQVAYQSPQASIKLMTESPFVDSGFAVPVFSPGDDSIACLNKAVAFLTTVASLRQCTQPKRQRNAAWYKEKAMLAEAQEAGQIFDEEQLAFLANPGIPAGQVQTIIPHNVTFHTEDLDTYDSDCDDLSNAQAVLMANISNYGSDIISEEKANKEQNKESITAELERYKERVKTFEQRLNIDFSKEEIRSKMSKKAKHPEVFAMKISHKPIDYEKLNRLTDDFGKRFTPQQELSAEQAFWLHISNPIIESSLPSVRVEVPSELPKVSLVNESLKKLKFQLAQFDSVVKKRTNLMLLQKNDLKAQLKDKDTTIRKLKDIIKSLRKNNKEEIVDHDRCDLATINAELENSVAKLLSENERKAIVDNTAQIPSATTIVPGMFKLDLEPLAPKLMHNRESHIFYLKHTQDQADILQGILVQAKAKQSLDNELDFSCTVRFGNDQITRIMGYGDYQLGNIVISRVRFLKKKDEAHAAIIKCIKNIQVRLKATVWNVRTDNGIEFVNQTLREFYENVGISHQTSIVRTPQQNDVVERRNSTLVEATRTMLIFSEALLFLWTEAINTACYTQNRSLIRHRYNKTLYELMQHKKPDLSFLHVFGSLCNHINDHEDMGKFDAKADIGIFDAPSTSIPSSQAQEHSLIISEGFKESPKTPTFHDDPLNESPQDSPSQGSSSNMIQIHTLFEHLGRWTKDHPIANVIGDPSLSVSTIKQLKTNAMWCYFDAFLSLIDSKNFNQAMTKPSWIDAMQEEIHKFEILNVWELVSCPDNVFLIKLKWIYKIKKDKSGK